MRKLLLTLAYDGAAFHGWQVQPNGVTVQQTLQDAMQRLYGSRPDVTGCSRTDAGVHARQFCCHFCDDGAREPREILRALNAMLPRSVAVTDCRVVPADFHARYSCRGKRYVYRMYVSPVRDPFREGYALRLARPLDEARAARFCEAVCGTHDFAGFSGAARTTQDTVRTLTDCRVVRQGDELHFTVCADGFLYNMVRILVGTLFWVDEGKIDPASIRERIAARDRSLAGPTAPPYALYLDRVFYDDITLD